MRLIIGDTSCLILFNRIGRLDILQKTFASLAITDKVAEEYGTVPEWIDIKRDYDQTLYRKFNVNFGPGESSCMALALLEDNPLLIIDDRRAKQVAKDVGIECTGSLGVLLIAKNYRVIEAVGPIVSQIETTDFRISDKTTKAILRLAKED